MVLLQTVRVCSGLSLRALSLTLTTEIKEGRAAVVLFAPPAPETGKQRARRHFIRIGPQGTEEHFEDEKGHRLCERHEECVTGMESANNGARNCKASDSQYPTRPPRTTKSSTLQDIDEPPPCPAKVKEPTTDRVPDESDAPPPTRKTREQIEKNQDDFLGEVSSSLVQRAKEANKKVRPTPSWKGKENEVISESSGGGKYTITPHINNNT